ncbi:hypothetical protein J113_09860 [Mycobacterium tuberculosis CAS/NITR204]|uniref:Uncharacterized protein n=1 Tax=Mycobacterium tuberculosis CAS/NITR204 TaxID=1310114 RepID=R4MD31_MYCTX|nr:hypothetical protein J113_09860 [Mycobacterium tuberculosis CAS/NITR204]
MFGTDAAAVMATVDFDENIDRASGVCGQAPVFEQLLVDDGIERGQPADGAGRLGVCRSTMGR